MFSLQRLRLTRRNSCFMLLVTIVVITVLPAANHYGSFSPVIKGPSLGIRDHLVPVYNVSHIFYNRVPKCASLTMGLLQAKLRKRNHFHIENSRIYMEFMIPKSQQKDLAEKIDSLEFRTVYNRHVHFINFERFGLKQPVYINIIRDPIERLNSWYYFRRFQPGHERKMSKDKRDMSYNDCVINGEPECTDPQGNNSTEEGYFKIIPFFCGHETFCLQPTKAALEQAKANVVKHYLVVGLQEEMSRTVFVMQHLMPEYFDGASKEYLKMSQKKRINQNKYKPDVSQIATDIMKHKLALEYEFYDFIKERLHNQLSHIISTTVS